MNASALQSSDGYTWNRRDAFTLSEALVALSIGTLIMAGVLTTYLLSVKSLQALSNYWEIHSDGRFAVDRFAADMRAVSSLVSMNATQLVCVVPLAFSGSGSVISNKTVSYVYAGDRLYRTETISGTTTRKTLAENIYQLNFRLYDKVGNPTVVLSSAKQVQLDMKLRKYVVGQSQTEEYLSARLVMRNIP